MQIPLVSILRHELFDWKSRHNRSSLLQNMGVVVKDMTSHDVPSHESSDLFKITKKVYDLSKKPKNARKGLEDFLKKRR